MIIAKPIPCIISANETDSTPNTFGLNIVFIGLVKRFKINTEYIIDSVLIPKNQNIIVESPAKNPKNTFPSHV